MGMFDTILIPCPRCGAKYEAQSKSGDCILAHYELSETPVDVLADVNHHAPFACESCGAVFAVQVYSHAVPTLVNGGGPE